MRTAIIIVGTLLLLATAGMGFLGTKKSLSDAKDVEQVLSMTTGEADGGTVAAAMKKEGFDPKRMKLGAVALAISALLALALLTLMFVNKGVPQVAIGLIAVAVLAIVVSPQYETGATGGLSARTFGYVVAVIGGLGAAAAYGARTLKARA